tara:strand:- start:342 stop:527 length:186 start_codon:yes stop_codon:yes gene_type:complete
MNKNRILSQLSEIENQISSVTERLYNPIISTGEVRELNRKKKKLIKSKSKLTKRLDNIVSE